MQQFDLWLSEIHTYPRWLVIAGLVAVAVVALWLVAKLFQWTLQLLFALAMIAVVAGVVFWVFV